MGNNILTEQYPSKQTEIKWEISVYAKIINRWEIHKHFAVQIIMKQMFDGTVISVFVYIFDYFSYNWRSHKAACLSAIWILLKL